LLPFDAVHSRIRAASLLAVLAPLLVVGPARAAGPVTAAPRTAHVERVPGLLVIGVDGPAAAAAAAARLGAVDAGEITPGFHLLRLPTARARAAAEQRTPGAQGAAELAGVAGISVAYAPVRAHAAASPDDPLVPKEQHLPIVRAPAVWSTGAVGSSAVRVAILDTAIPAHPDLPTPVASFDRVSAPTGCDEGVRLSEMAHGTHVAGIALAVGNNATGTTGVTWTSGLLHGRVLDDCGSGTTADIAAAITWAADNGAFVINLSLGADGEPDGSDPDPALHAAVIYARNKGALVVAAAGNAAPADVRFPQYPGAYAEVIGVANTRDDDATASSSVRGPWVDMAAPGTHILSTLPDGMPAVSYEARAGVGGSSGPGWGYFTGTSMSSPLVAGAAALLKAADPSLSAGAVQARLVRSAHPVHRSATSGTCADFNAGRLDIESARRDEVNAFGYRMVSPGGQVAAFGDECFLGDASALKLAGSIIGVATTQSKAGYWLVGSDGGIFTYGDAEFFGSTGAKRLNAPVIGMASTASGRGYWLVAADGGIFTYGDAAFFGSTGGIRLNSPVIGIAATPTGRGYWLVAADGGIFAFGDAAFFGSTGAIHLVRPVLAMQSTPTGRGYWMVASDGGIFAFGDAAFFGSTGGRTLNRPIIGMVAAPKGDGYWLVGSDGGIFTFGNIPFFGSAAATGRTVNAASG
jgi:subtilisin family serine protease